MILTFGLLSPDKGIEHVIDALPAILARHPDTVYIVLGATHPHVKERHGETYRLMLEHRAQRLGVDSSMIFHNRFVSQDELAEFLAAADIYITPYLQPEQITSGTLAYAVGAGKAVISTPYLYARELLADGRGILVPWRDPQAIAREVIDLLGDDAKRLALRAACRRPWSRACSGPRSRVATCRASSGRAERTPTGCATSFQAKTLARATARAARDQPRAPPPHDRPDRHAAARCLQHPALRRGLLSRRQRARAAPDGAYRGRRHGGRQDVRALASRYLAFVSHAFNKASGRFRNFMSYSRQWLEECGSEDSHGRALWALGTVVGRSSDPGKQSLGGHLFHAALAGGRGLHEPARVGLRAARDRRVPARVPGRQQRAVRAQDAGGAAARPLPADEQARVAVVRGPGHLLQRAIVTSAHRVRSLDGARRDDRRAGLRSLEWLASIQCSTDGYFAPIGSNGFYERGGRRRPRSTSNPSRRARWSRPVSRRIG